MRKKSAIRYGWGDEKQNKYLRALHAFYRLLNRIGFHDNNDSQAYFDDEAAATLVAFFADGDGKAIVSNYQAPDGRTFTLMLVKVSDVGPVAPEGALHV